MLTASLLVTVMGALVKHLGETIPIAELAATRSLFLLIAILPFMMRQRHGVFSPGKPGLLIARSATLVIVNVVGFWVLTKLPLVLVTSLSFTKPLFITLLAAVFLGEKLRLRRSLATLTGFAGVVLMLDPFGQSLPPGQIAAALVALFVALSMAVGVILVKKLAASDHPNTIIFYGNLAVITVLAIPAAIGWVAPTPGEWGLLIGVGLVGLASQHCFIRAYRAAEASYVAPFEYVRVLSAALLGYWMFQEMPGPMTFIGAGVIIAAAFYIARREAALGHGGRAALPEPPAPVA